jgi:hypothetical protein
MCNECGDDGCICDRLRACEARVRDGWEPWCNEVSYDAGHAAALDAARDAVAAMEPLLSETPLHGGYDCCGCSTLDQLHADALAAIDALRGES